MTAIPQMECCTMLGIDPKTLRNWRESCSSALRCPSHRCTPQMFDARASPAVGYPACECGKQHARPIVPLATASAALRQEATPLASTLSPSSSSQPNESRLADAPAACSEEARLRTVV